MFISIVIVSGLSYCHHKAGHYFSRGRILICIMFLIGGLAFNIVSGLFASGTNNLLFNHDTLKESKVRSSLSGVNKTVSDVYSFVLLARQKVNKAASLSSNRAIIEKSHGGTCAGNPSKKGPGDRTDLRNDLATKLNDTSSKMNDLLNDATSLRSRIPRVKTNQEQQNLFIEAVGILNDNRLDVVAGELSTIHNGFINGFPKPSSPSESMLCGDQEMQDAISAAISALNKEIQDPEAPSGTVNPTLSDSIQNTINTVITLITGESTSGFENKIVMATLPTISLTLLIEAVCLIWAFSRGISSNNFRHTSALLMGLDDYEEMPEDEAQLQAGTYQLIDTLRVEINHKTNRRFLPAKVDTLNFFLVPQTRNKIQQQASLFVKKTNMQQIEVSKAIDVGNYLMDEDDAQYFQSKVGTRMVKVYYWNRAAEQIMRKVVKNIGIRGVSLLGST